MCKYLFYFLLFPVLLHSSNQFFSYSPELAKPIERIYQLPDALKLISLANQFGPVSVVATTKETAAFQGMWVGSSRTIYVNVSSKKSLGSLIQTIIFELHNAVGSRDFALLWEKAMAGQVSKNQFIERAERFEYNHLKKAQVILEKGISQGIFPKDSRISVIPDFELHYYYQQLAGHSDWFSQQYDKCCPSRMQTTYRGTVKDLTVLSPQDKNDLMRYISLCRKLCIETPPENNEIYDKILQEQEMLTYKLAYVNMEGNCAARRLELFNEVFRNIL